MQKVLIRTFAIGECTEALRRELQYHWKGEFSVQVVRSPSTVEALWWHFPDWMLAEHEHTYRRRDMKSFVDGYLFAKRNRR